MNDSTEAARKKRIAEAISRRRKTFAENRSYRSGYEDGFEMGARAGVAADRLFLFVLGCIAGALVAIVMHAIR